MDTNIRSVDTLGIFGGKVVLAIVGGGYLRRYWGGIGVARIPLQNCGERMDFRLEQVIHYPDLSHRANTYSQLTAKTIDKRS